MQTIFSSSATNKVDAKGRVSIPAPFRKALQDGGDSTLYLMPEIMERPAIVGFGAGHYRRLADSVMHMPPFDPVAEALSDALGSEARELPLDGTGRIVLPADLKALAEIEEDALFVGRLSHFQIWRPEHYAAMKADLRRTARENASALPWSGARTA